MFVLTRFGVGLGLGGNLAVDFTMFLEFVQERLRGRVMMMLTMWGVAGVGFIALTAWFVLATYGWRWYTVVGSLPSGFLLMMRLSIPESPAYLWSQGKAEAAWDVLISIADRNGAPHALEGLALLPPPPPLHSQGQGDDGQGGDFDCETCCHSSLCDTIMGPAMRRTTLSLWATWFFQSFAYGGFTLWLPAFLASQGFHSDVQIYKNYGLMAAAEVPGLLLATVLVDIVGRKWLLSGLLVACCITTALCATDPGPTAITALTAAMYFFVVGAWATLYVLTPEAYPTHVRSTGSGVTRIWACLGGMLAGPVGAMLIHRVRTLMLIYAGAFACACIVVVGAMPSALGRGIVD
jgi:putative MFS transporter